MNKTQMVVLLTAIFLAAGISGAHAGNIPSAVSGSSAGAQQQAIDKELLRQKRIEQQRAQARKEVIESQKASDTGVNPAATAAEGVVAKGEDDLATGEEAMK